MTGHTRSTRWAAVLVISALATTLGGCASKTKSQASTSDAGALGGPKVDSKASSTTEVAIVNEYCPIAPSHRVGRNKTTVSQHTRIYKGQRVGFCCDGCPGTWDSLTEQQRDAALAAAMAKEAKSGM